MIEMTDKRVLITGASGGIGSETARRMAAAGARLTLHGWRNVAALQALASQIGDKAHIATGNAADPADMARIADEAAGAMGGIDVLVHVSGTSPQMPFGAITAADFTALMNDNVLSAVLAMQEAARHMGEGARMVLVSSNLCYGPMAGLVPYCAAKSALITLAQGFARELGPRRIAVNTVAPGATETPMTTWLPDDLRAGIAAATPLGRMGKPDDVADAILFLASDAARWVNGRTLIVDGGLI